MKKIILLYLLFVPFMLFSQQEEAEKYIIAGNGFYKQQKYEQAIAEYVKALQLDPSNSTARFNHANALYKAGLQVEASQKFTELSATVTENDMKAKSFYNKGVILSAQKNLEESIEAYKNALRLDPNDKEARENLQKALLELKKKNPQQQNQDDKKDQDKKQQQKQNQSKLNQREAEQRLRLLSQKEKEVQERIQKEKARSGGGQGKDW